MTTHLIILVLTIGIKHVNLILTSKYYGLLLFNQAKPNFFPISLVLPFFVIFLNEGDEGGY